MYIERIQVEEGFLNGLDVSFTTGLNVVIGARGTGKTSLIELIRFCLDIGSASEQNKRSLEHALSILGSGQVTVTINDNGQKIIVTKTVADFAARATAEFTPPLIFSQTEIETIGLESNGRVRLIDSFLPEEHTNNSIEESVISEIHSLTAELESAQRDFEEFEKQLRGLGAIEQELSKLQESEKNVSSGSIELKNKTEMLQNLSEVISKLTVSESQGKAAQDIFANWYNQIKSALEFNTKVSNVDFENLEHLLPHLNDTVTHLNQALENVRIIWATLDSKNKVLATERIDAEGAARSLRQEVEVIQTGAGMLMRRIQELKQNQAQLNSLNESFKMQLSYITQLQSKRDNALDRLDLIRLERFKKRAYVVDKLNDILKPMIKIDLLRNGQHNGFFSMLTDMLRGVGLRYSDVAKTLSEHISPRALLDAIERFDVDLISEIAGIPNDRASRVLSQLRTSFLGGLGTLHLDDDISFKLLDGMDYKDLSLLSTGQRCTVILPIVLAHQDKTLIVDQPEDHIDNAFITNTLIKSILNRSTQSQIIFTTHNPNIPVLGNADNVLHLGSDGKHGFIEAEGSLNERNIVDAISTVMEGGEEAFAQRASFYSQFIK